MVPLLAFTLYPRTYTIVLVNFKVLPQLFRIGYREVMGAQKRHGTPVAKWTQYGYNAQQ